MVRKTKSKRKSKRSHRKGDHVHHGSSKNVINIRLVGAGSGGSQPFPVMMPFSNMQEQSRVNSIPQTPYNSSVPDFLGHSSYHSYPSSMDSSPRYSSSIPQSVSMPNAQSTHILKGFRGTSPLNTSNPQSPKQSLEILFSSIPQHPAN